MEKDDTVSSFFTNISHVRDCLPYISVIVEDDGLVQTHMEGLPSSWETFLFIVNGHEFQSNFERLRHEFLQKEGSIHSRNGTSNEMNMAIASNMRGRKGKGFSPRNKNQKVRDLVSNLSCPI